MVELGKHAMPVLMSYGLTLLALALLVAVSWRGARITKRNMDAAEARRAAKKAAQDGA